MLGSPGTAAMAAIRLPIFGPTKRNLKALSFSESAAFSFSESAAFCFSGSAADAARAERLAVSTMSQLRRVVLVRIGFTFGQRGRHLTSVRAARTSQNDALFLTFLQNKDTPRSDPIP